MIVATHNSNKLREIEQILGPDSGISLFSGMDFPDLAPPEETGSTFEENARIKAEFYAKACQLPALGDDSGLEVDALDGRPGVYSARYAPTDAERISKLLEELKDVDGGERSARFRCAMCLAWPDRIIAEESGTIEGFIARSPKGSNGFGYDPVFALELDGIHLSEISAEEKNRISHRGKALHAVISAVESLAAKVTP